MKQLTASALLLLLASCSATRPGAAAYASQDAPAAASPAQRDRANRITLYFGGRGLDEDDWSPVDEQAVFGVEYSREPAGSVIGWELGIQGSGDESTVAGFDVTGSTGELYGGVRKTFGSGVVRPYVGGGLSLIGAEVEVSGAGSEDDSSPAGYGHVGVAFLVTPSFFLGLDLRVLFGSDLSLAGQSTDADYGQLALHLGWSF